MDCVNENFEGNKLYAVTDLKSMDVSAELLAKLHNVAAEVVSLNDKAMERVPAVGYAVPMIVDCSEARANYAVDRVTPWGFADFSAIFRNMLSVLHRTMERASMREEPFRLFLNTSQELDPDIERILDIEHFNLLVLNERVSINSRMHTIEKVGERYRISLASSRRRNALTLMHLKSSYLQHSEEERELLKGLRAGKVTDQDAYHEHLVELTLALEMKEIDILRKGLPDVWQDLLDGLQLQDSDLTTFLGFTVKMGYIPFQWQKTDTLFDLCGAFARTYKREEIPKERFDRLLTILSSDLKEAKDAGTAVPFIKFGNWIRFWPFSYHILLPELVFITAVQNKHEGLWSKTFGSKLAKAANCLVRRLPDFKNLIVATVKKKSGIGDIDLTIFDKNTRELLVCEIKTVFDKFRTDFQAGNFAKQKVNFEKAKHQLNNVTASIACGTWKLEDIFSGAVKGEPSKIHRLILLWRDQFNPLLDDSEYIPVATFNTFVYLFSEARGDLCELVDTIGQLERVFWISRYVDDFWPIGNDRLLLSRELETDVLPPLSYVNELSLTKLAAKEISTLRHAQENWQEQLSARGDEEQYHFVTGLA